MKLLSSLVFFFVVLLSVSCSANDQAASNNKLAHHTEDGFKNLYIEDLDKGFFDFLRMRFFGDETWADHSALASQVATQPVELQRIHKPAETAQITWLGHSTFLIQYKGINTLTDPMFSDRASPYSFAGPERYVPHVIDYSQLPKIDAVVISHNHYDHLDEESIQMLSASAQFYVPLGLKAWFEDLDVDSQQITEFDWWDTKSINFQGTNMQIQALPSQHWSARGLGDRFETLWASWSITIANQHVWFAGDTGYNNIQFKDIGERIAPVDLALIPIGAYAPRWFMQHYHVNPAEAVKIHQDVGATKSIGMHWGTFPLTAEEPVAPVIELEKAKKAAKIDNQAFISMAIGQTLVLP